MTVKRAIKARGIIIRRNNGTTGRWMWHLAPDIVRKRRISTGIGKTSDSVPATDRASTLDPSGGDVPKVLLVP